VVVNDRWGKGSRHRHGGYWTTEYTPGMSGVDHPWEESRGGNLVLDIGPAADGTIPVVMEERLIRIGDRLKVNGEAIYGAKPCKATRKWSAGEGSKIEDNKEFETAYDLTKLAAKPAPGKASIEAFFTSKGGVSIQLPEIPEQLLNQPAGALKVSQ
jgi:alpha-L-fucosidase